LFVETVITKMRESFPGEMVIARLDARSRKF